MTIKQYAIDADRAAALMQKILAVCAAENRPMPEVEYAIVMAYGNVAGGIRDYPAATREARFWRWMGIATSALCQAVVDVGLLTDADIKMWVVQQKALQRASPTSTIQ